MVLEGRRGRAQQKKGRNGREEGGGEMHLSWGWYVALVFIFLVFLGVFMARARRDV